MLAEMLAKMLAEMLARFTSAFTLTSRFSKKPTNHHFFLRHENLQDPPTSHEVIIKLPLK